MGQSQHQGDRHIHPGELPAGDVATTTHVGSQEESVKAYEALHEWVQKSGRQPGGAPWEVYGSDTAMQIYFPLR